MGFSLKRIDGFITALLKRETDPINQARIRVLAYIILGYIFYSGILIVAYILEKEMLQLIRAIFTFVSCFVFLNIIKNFGSWKVVSHLIICFLTLTVWSNLSIFVMGVNVATLQYVWFACALGFYMHDINWAWFYSAMNVLPIVIYTATDNNFYFLGSGPHHIALNTYIFVICYNFGFILFLHYYFFKAFHRNFTNLTYAKNELKELNEKLKLTLTDLEKLSKDRMNFLSTMSHELRTPMNGVIGISNELLLQNPRADQEENMAILKFSADNLLALINDILDFNKLESDKAELENIAFDLHILLENNFASLRPKAQEKQLDFRFEMDETIKGKVLISDPTRLTQVLCNLLSNSIKFTAEGAVHLSAKLVKQTADLMRIQFLVEDTGIGIESHRQDEVFEAFVQASSSTNRKYGGTGLGLPIVKKILHMFNSQISLTSEKNAGTKISFSIDFRYTELDLSKIETIRNKPAELGHLRVLVAEDNHVNILVIKKTLERWGISPAIAENGVQALEQLEKEDFDVILMDLNMPELDGYETSIAIRNLQAQSKSSIPIIAFTATTNNNVSRKILEAGMNDYMPKPFKPEDLFDKLQQLNAVKSPN
ncbi:response regulator [Pedobacter sp. MC2016-14]|uniref:response regulator n=1 Tax=Pedobacter sp. MC2016-14 TaxID=2897327 RepID=UPI001E44CFDF|nr:response regulator [Pedobacter sp. MC2016-14]MCD0487397.1 response regulator [Pedobacter sp. MC2016-14]